MVTKPDIGENEHSHRQVFWYLGHDEEGEAVIDTVGFDVKMVQIAGEFAGAEVVILGQVLPNEFDLLTDYENFPLVFSMKGIKSTDDRVMSIKPKVNGGTELTKLKIGLLLCR